MTGHVKLFGDPSDWENADEAQPEIKPHDPTTPVELADAFKPPRITLAVVNEASRHVSQETYIRKGMGLCRWLELAAEHAFKQMPVSNTSAKLGAYILEFEYESDGPVLKSFRLG